MIKKILLGSVLAVLSLQAAHAASAGKYGDFQYAALSDLKPFARDLGGLLDSGTNQTARVLGFGGYDVSGRTVVQFEPESGDGILKKNKPFGLGWVQAEIGMPFRIDGFIKAGSFANLALSGGGLKYGFTQPQKKLQAMIVLTGNMASHKFFYATHFASSLIFSVNTPFIAPYFGAGMDNTNLTVQNNLGDPSLVGKRIAVYQARYMAGFRMTFLSYGYLSGGYTYTHGRGLVNAGLGLRI